MISVLSLIRKKEKLAEVIRSKYLSILLLNFILLENPKNKIKKSEHMNSRLNLFQAV